jgi:hypothetical protein
MDIRRCWVWPVVVAGLVSCSGERAHTAGLVGTELEPTTGGMVTIEQSRVQLLGGESFVHSVAEAWFFAKEAGPRRCAVQHVAGCTLWACAELEHELAANAGEIAIRPEDDEVTLLQPAFDGEYARPDRAVPQLAAGQPVVIAAKGGVVPAFQTTLQTPRSIEVTTMMGKRWPVAPEKVDLRAPLSLRWKAQTEGKLGLEVKTTVTHHTTIMRCSFPASAGAAEVPLAAQAALPSGTAEVTVFGLEEGSLRVGDFDITVALKATATVADSHGGRLAQGEASMP